MTKLTTRDAARGFAETLNSVAYGRTPTGEPERIMLTRRGRPMAVLLSISDFEQLRMRAWLNEMAA
jgi:prevent-host-death family protein